MAMMLRRLVRLAPLALLCASSALAQTTSSITGVVTDASTNKPVVGAVVVVTGPAEQTVVSEAGGKFTLPDLPPGDYTARAEISVEGRPVGAVTRPFRVVPLRAGQSPASSPLASLLVEASPFDRTELLKPEVLGRFVDGALSIVPGPAPAGVTAAAEKARQGRPEAMLDGLDAAAKEDARVAFLRGVSFYARGSLQAALTQLQVAMRQSSDLFPAAVYVGACYAASGKDLDAIGAWQTGLIGESGSPVLYALLGDALLRAKEERQAVEILTEGLAVFPEDAGLRRRLGIAHAMAGDREEALPLLTAWVEAHPEDNGALLATLALLFDGFAREAAGTAPVEERQRLVRFAKAYVEGTGPNREVIARWLKYLESRQGG